MAGFESLRYVAQTFLSASSGRLSSRLILVFLQLPNKNSVKMRTNRIYYMFVCLQDILNILDSRSIKMFAQKFWLFLVCVSLSGLAVAAETEQNHFSPKVIPIAEFQKLVFEHGRAIESFRIEGVVC